FDPEFARNLEHVLDVIDTVWGNHRHRDGRNVAPAQRLDCTQDAGVGTGMALPIMYRFGTVERHAHEVEIAKFIDPLGHQPTVGIKGGRKAVALRVTEVWPGALGEQRLPADDAGAAQAARMELVDGAKPFCGAHFVAVLQRDLTIGAAEVAPVGQGEGHLEGALAVQESAHAQLEDWHRIPDGCTPPGGSAAWGIADGAQPPRESVKVELARARVARASVTARVGL